MAGAVAGGLMAVSALAAAQRPVVWSVATASRGPIPPGTVVNIELHARIDSGWHMYALTQGPGGPIRTQISVAPHQAFSLADSVRGPAPTKRFDPNFGINVDTYDQYVSFVVPIRVAATARPGQDSVRVNARFQTCDATLCLPPHTETLTVPIMIGTARPIHART
jgi:thiol:disulfide interchange protein DsbD